MMRNMLQQTKILILV